MDSMACANCALTSEVGQLDYFERANIIIVKDTKPVLDQIEAIIRKIDVEPGQVFIDVKFVTTTNKDILEYGIDIGDDGWTALKAARMIGDPVFMARRA